MNGSAWFEETQGFASWAYVLIFVLFLILFSVLTLRQTTIVASDAVTVRYGFLYRVRIPFSEIAQATFNMVVAGRVLSSGDVAQGVGCAAQPGGIAAQHHRHRLAQCTEARMHFGADAAGVRAGRSGARPQRMLRKTLGQGFGNRQRVPYRRDRERRLGAVRRQAVGIGYLPGGVPRRPIGR